MIKALRAELDETIFATLSDAGLHAVGHHLGSELITRFQEISRLLNRKLVQYVAENIHTIPSFLANATRSAEPVKNILRINKDASHLDRLDATAQAECVEFAVICMLKHPTDIMTIPSFSLGDICDRLEAQTLELKNCKKQIATKLAPALELVGASEYLEDFTELPGFVVKLFQCLKTLELEKRVITAGSFFDGIHRHLEILSIDENRACFRDLSALETPVVSTARAIAEILDPEAMQKQHERFELKSLCSSASAAEIHSFILEHEIDCRRCRDWIHTDSLEPMAPKKVPFANWPRAAQECLVDIADVQTTLGYPGWLENVHKAKIQQCRY